MLLCKSIGNKGPDGFAHHHTHAVVSDRRRCVDGTSVRLYEIFCFAVTRPNWAPVDLRLLPACLTCVLVRLLQTSLPATNWRHQAWVNPADVRRLSTCLEQCSANYLYRGLTDLNFFSVWREIGRAVISLTALSALEPSPSPASFGELPIACRSIPSLRRNRFSRVNLFAAIDPCSGGRSDPNSVMLV